MNDDSESTVSCRGKRKTDHLDRRQFLNGLGKWSLAVIAAVASLREGMRDMRSGFGSRFDAPSAGPGDSRQRIARKKRPHGDQPHLDEAHSDSPGQPHRDYYRILKPQEGSGTTSPSGGSRSD